MNNVEDILHKSVYGHTETKQQIKRIVGQWINGEMKGQVFGLVDLQVLVKQLFVKMVYQNV